MGELEECLLIEEKPRIQGKSHKSKIAGKFPQNLDFQQLYPAHLVELTLIEQNQIYDKFHSLSSLAI
jgi:hypothetical protein